MSNTKIIESVLKDLSGLDIDRLSADDLLEVGRAEYILEKLLENKTKKEV